MKLRNKTLLGLLFSLMFVFGTQKMFAQRTVVIPPGFGTLGSTIMGDTTGGRDTNTVYLLKRDSLYILDGTFEPKFPVIIQAMPGTGGMPRIILGMPTGGSLPGETFRPKANIYLKGLYISGQGELGGMGSRIIRISANGMKVVVDSCQLDVASQSAFRIESNSVDLRLTNSIVSNIGQMISPENGRAIDNRGVNIDSIYIQNCSFYNLTSTVYRDGGGTLNYLFYNHNTAVNLGFHGLTIGEAKNVFVSNNIFKDCAFLGTTVTAGQVISLSPYPDPTVTQQAIFKNNNIFIDTNIVKVYPDSVLAPVPFDSLSKSYVTSGGFTNSNINEFLLFKKEPSLPKTTVTTYWSNPSGTQVDMDTVGQANFDFSYANSYKSYLASSDGKPLGALSWFGMLVGIKDKPSNNLPSQYQLQQNYPNPFNPTTTIQYSLVQPGEIRLGVYNMLGQLVRTLVDDVQSAGTHSIIWDGSNNAGQKVSSGIYLYQLTAGNFVSVKKMIMLK
ncbi:MAG: FlgD immunoglobulin-like domain containing protein [Ignavibacteriaceae bacterium]